MAKTLFIVEDGTFAKLPKAVHDKALAETKKLFSFVPAFKVSAAQPAQFPARIDFTDSVFRLLEDDDALNVYMNDSFRKQSANVRSSIKQNGFKLQDPGGGMVRFPATPERSGIGFQQKEILTAGSAKLAMAVTIGTGSLAAIEEEVVEEGLAHGRAKQDVVDDIAKHSVMKDGSPNVHYFMKAQSLRDQADLLAYDLLKQDLATWPADAQEMVGVALARVIAHEARHQYVATPVHAVAGLGAESPRIWGDKNYGQFSSDDQSDILTALQALEAKQRTAAVLLETNPKGQAFPF